MTGHLHWLPAIVGVLLCAACAVPAPPSLAPAATATAANSTPTARAPTSAPTPVPTPASAAPGATAQPATPAPAAVGWLLVGTRFGVQSTAPACPMLAASDRRASSRYNDPSRAAAPTGGWLALLTSSNASAEGYYFDADLRLELTHLPDCARRSVSPLVSDQLQRALNNPDGAAPPPAAFAIRGALPVSWSPDGRSLAFLAALEADSADLYIYRPADGNLRRLTNGPLHVLGFWWSPDSRRLVYQAGMPSRPHYDSSLQGVYVVAAEGGTPSALYTLPPGALGESFDGWLNDSTIVVHGSTGPNQFSMRAVDVATARIQTLSKSYTESAAAEPRGGTSVFGVRADSGGGAPAPGLYLVRGTSVTQVYTCGVLSLRWSPAASRYLADSSCGGVLALSPGGETTFFRDESTGFGRGFAAAPDGNALAFFAERGAGRPAGIRLYTPNGERLREFVTAGAVRAALFSPDASVLAYALADESGYYLLRLSEPQPERVALTSTVEMLGWARAE